ncbi:unnamed protein product [Symbiodinium sp. CCMP2592]|nr:unnamed protein product [Symbiodinium sp. CCMP2592]
MGKKAQWSAEEWEAWRSSSYYGGWQRPKGKAKEGKGGQAPKGREMAKDKKSAFPSFEAMDPAGMTQRNARPKDAMEVDEEPPASGQVARGMQKVLNNLRRAEVKSRRLEEDRTELQQKRETYRRELQQGFIREKHKFQERLAKISAELAEAEQNQEDALLELQAVMIEPQAALRPKPEQAEDPEMMAELEQLLQSPEKQPRRGLADLLAGALQSSSGSRDDKRKLLQVAIEEYRRQGAPATPPRRRTREPPGTPPDLKMSEPPSGARASGDGTYSGGGDLSSKPEPYHAMCRRSAKDQVPPWDSDSGETGAARGAGGDGGVVGNDDGCMAMTCSRSLATRLQVLIGPAGYGMADFFGSFSPCPKYEGVKQPGVLGLRDTGGCQHQRRPFTEPIRPLSWAADLFKPQGDVGFGAAHSREGCVALLPVAGCEHCCPHPGAPADHCLLDGQDRRFKVIWRYGPVGGHVRPSKDEDIVRDLSPGAAYHGESCSALLVGADHECCCAHPGDPAGPRLLGDQDLHVPVNWRHGPTGGHVRPNQNEELHMHGMMFSEYAAVRCMGWLIGLEMVQFVALLSMLYVVIGGKRQQARRARHADVLGHPKILLAYAVLSGNYVAQAFAHPPPLQRCELPAAHTALGVPRQTDLELWASGQLTAREHMLRAYEEVIWNAPLGHSEGEVAPPNLLATTVSEQLGPAPLSDEDRRAVHITIWVASPFFETVIVDLGIAFPILSVGSHYGSCLAVPAWIQAANKFAMVLDSRGVGGELFAFYHDGPVTREAIMKQLPEDDNEIDLYLFGSMVPLAADASQDPIQGGVVKAYYTGDHCTWESPLQDRLTDPTQWNPRLNPPSTSSDPYVVYQSPDDQLVYYDLPDADAHRQQLAEQLMAYRPGQCWTKEPQRTADALTHAGRAIRKQIAVIPGPQSTPEDDPDTTVLFVDLRGLALFPQWMLLPGQLFNSTDYLADLPVPVVDGWTVVVEGGARTEHAELLRVANGEMLNIFLQETDQLTASQADEQSEGPGSGPDDDEGDSSDPFDALPHSSDLSTPSPPRGPPPYGPPRPEPVNRSRSPRRRCASDTAVTSATSLCLQGLLPPPVVELDVHQVQLPHGAADVNHMFRPWAPDWIYTVLPTTVPAETEMALSQLRHWSDLLCGPTSAEPPAIHIYVDGSWHEQRKVGGYAVAIFLVTAGSAALFGLLGEQLQGNPQSPWTFDAAPALKAEQTALMTAMLWCLQSRAFLIPAAYCIFYDCKVAGCGATGLWDAGAGLGLQNRALAQFLRDALSTPISIEHVRAHNGDPYNGLVDALAKAVAKQSAMLAAPPAEICELVQHVDFSWLPLEAQDTTREIYPLVTGQCLRWSEEVAFTAPHIWPDQLIPTTGDASELHATTLGSFSTKLLTLNAQTLTGLTESKAFMRISSASESHWGVSIWLNKSLGFLTRDGSKVPAREEDIRIIVEQPRLLVAVIDIGGPKVVVFAAHCPDGSKGAAADDFLENLAGVLRPYKRSCLVLGGIDLNGRLPGECEGHTGDLAFGQEDANGAAMLRHACELGLWFPSTYRHLHTGSSATFRHVQGSLHRIDFTVVGGLAEVWAAHSYVDEHFDTLNPNDDHLPAIAELQGSLGESCGRRRVWRPRFDTEKMLTTAGKQIIAEELERYSPPRWHVHPDQHCQHLQDFLLGVMQKHFRRDEHGPRAAYLSPEIWALRGAKVAHKLRTRYRAGLWSAILCRAFLQWICEENYYGVQELTKKYGLLYELSAAAVSFATGRIKRGIREDKAKFLSVVAKDGTAKAEEVLGIAKKAGVGGRQARPFHRPLPALLRPDGQLCSSRADRDETWLQQFSAQECGVVQLTEDYLAGRDRQITIDCDLGWSLGELPSYFEVEQAFRCAPARKSCGLDCLPGELLRADPAGITKAAFPLFLKATVSLRQPIQWRGGLLRESWKRKGTVREPANYRSLFVSSMLGKVFHKVLRSRATQHAADMLLSFQMGARKQAPVTLPALFVQSILRRGHQDNISTGVLFLDVQSAYYTVIREMSVGLIEDDETVAKVFKYFGLSPDDLGEFWDDIHRGGIMGQSTLPSSLRHLAKDLMHKSWFITGYGTSERLCVTQAGSRPGEAWADLVFAFVLGKILCRIREAAAGEGLLQVLQADVESGPFAMPGDGTDVQALECAWADDAAFPTAARDPEALLRRMKRLCSVVLYECARHGLQPNLRPGKTAALLAIRGPGKARQRWFPHGCSALRLEDLGLEVPIVGSYVHLGGLVDAAMSGKGEVRRRLAIAQTAFDEGKRLLYTNVTIPLQVRSNIFQLSVGATFFNLGLWVPHGPQWQKMVGGFTRILRGLLTKHFKGDLLYYVAAPAVHILTGCMPLDMFARRSRLSLLASLCKAAPMELWAALQTEQAWLEAVRGDLRWLCEGDLQGPTADVAGWPELYALFAKRTSWVKNRVRRLLARDFETFKDEQFVNLQLWALHRRLLRRRPGPTEPCDWRCRPCGRTVRTRAALGAHFFKTHGRQAKHRPYVEGSRAWRKIEEETCHLAVPAPALDPLPPGRPARWDATLKDAHRALCDALLVSTLPGDRSAITDVVTRTLGYHPLFPDEEVEIAAYTSEELRGLTPSDLEDYWPAEVHAVLIDALATYRPGDATDGEVHFREQHSDSLQAFCSRLSDFNWNEALGVAEGPHETPEGALYKLCSRDVALNCNSEALTVATVSESFWPLIPTVLREAWDAAIDGKAVRIHAPKCFWEHRLSLPFRAMRDETAL